jgi:hypothetical protein
VLQLCSPLRRPEVGPGCVDSRVEFELITCGGAFLQTQNGSAHLGGVAQAVLISESLCHIRSTNLASADSAPLPVRLEGREVAER